MVDSFNGLVKNVIDGETFDLVVNQSEVFNKNVYKAIEQIRISHLYAREVIGPGRIISKDLLELV